MNAIVNIYNISGPGDCWGKTEAEERHEEAQERAYHEICERGILDIIGDDADEILMELWDGDIHEAKKNLKAALAARLGREYTDLLSNM